MEHSSGAVRTAYDIQVEGKGGPSSQPKTTAVIGSSQQLTPKKGAPGDQV